MKVAFYTLGCKVNQYETNLMKEDFLNNNYDVVDVKDKADIYVVNSCSVTNIATRKSRQFLSKCRKLNSDAIIVLTGCFAEELTFSKSNYNMFDIALGNEEKKNIVSYVNKYIEDNKGKIHHNELVKEEKLCVSDISKVRRYVKHKEITKAHEIRENIKIEDGCNNFCNYCIIPYTRGRVRSRDIDDIAKEAKNLALNGVKEVVLVGIEIISYGEDLDNKITLIDVIERINEIDGIERIRLGSLKPNFFTDENIIKLSKFSKLCHQFHLSVQSISNPVIKRMNRHYTREDLFHITDRLKKYFYDVTLTADIIVGYINESDEEFNDTYEGVKYIKFNDINVFKFSRREHTRAYDMESSVDDNTMNLRSEKLIELGNNIKNEFLNSLIGKRDKVLFEEYKDGYLYGYTSNYVKVKVKGDRELWGKVIEIEFLKIEKGIVLGVLI